MGKQCLILQPTCSSSPTLSSSCSSFVWSCSSTESKTGVIILFAWVSLRSKKLIMKPYVVSCASQTTAPAESWRRQTYIRADISPTTLRSLFLPALLSLSLSVCSLSSVTAEKRSCNYSFLSPFSFSLLFISLPLFYSTTNLSNPDLFLSSKLYLAVKYWAERTWQKKRTAEAL